MANGVKIDREHLKPVPVGKSAWEGFCQTNYTVAIKSRVEITAFAVVGTTVFAEMPKLKL